MLGIMLNCLLAKTEIFVAEFDALVIERLDVLVDVVQPLLVRLLVLAVHDSTRFAVHRANLECVRSEMHSHCYEF